MNNLAYETTLSESFKSENGIFYTSDFVIDYILSETLGEWLLEQKIVLKTIFDENSRLFYEKYLEKMLSVRILDPSCGIGNFLSGAFVFLSKELQNISNFVCIDVKFYQEIILKQVLYGVDIDKNACEIAQKNLKIKHIFCGDSLISDISISERAFDWEKAFPHVFEEGGFDIIIGNPPYVSFQTNLLKKSSIKFFTEHYETSYKIFDLFGLFIERSIKNLLKSKGILAFICPSVLLMNDSFSKLRSFMAKNGNFSRITFLADGVFREAVVPTITFSFQKNVFRKEVKIAYPIENKKIATKKSINSDLFYQNPEKGFNITISEKSLDLIEKLKKNTIPLGEILEIRESIKTGDDKNFISDTQKNTNYLPLVTGKDIQKFYLKQDRFILFDEKLLKRPTKLTYYQREKLFIRRVSANLIATYDDKNNLATHVLYVSFLKENQIFYIKYLLALLNSKLFDYVYHQLFPAKGKIFPEIRIGNLRELFVKNISLEEQGIFVKMVDEILSKKAQNQETNFLEKELDLLVYQLYELSETEIQLIENE